MKRAILSVVLLITACSNDPTGPSGLANTYFLSSVDGSPVPVALPGTTDGTTLLSSQLNFPMNARPRGPDASAWVALSQSIRGPDHQVNQSTAHLTFRIEAGVVRINLCPPFALCIIATNELIGIIGEGGDLVLTHFINDVPGTVYRYAAILPD